MAYRLLARNQPLSQQLQMAVQGKRTEGPPQCPTPPSSPFQPQGSAPPPGQQVSVDVRIHIVVYSTQSILVMVYSRAVFYLLGFYLLISFKH